MNLQKGKQYIDSDGNVAIITFIKDVYQNIHKHKSYGKSSWNRPTSFILEYQYLGSEEIHRTSSLLFEGKFKEIQ